MFGKKKVIIVFVLILAAIVAIRYYFIQEKKNNTSSSSVQLPPLNAAPASSPSSSIQATTTQETKTYRNEEWGFEFRYPKEWSFEVNSFYSPSSKFNLQGDFSAEDYNPLLPSFLLSIAMPDFADNVIDGWRQSGAIESKVVVDGVYGKKFEYTKPYPGISIILPFRNYGIILASKNKDYEDIFNQILASFRFLK